MIPDLPSYSLGKLVRSLGIPISDRHRASGDALATTKLFELLLNKDIDKSIVKTYIRLEPKRQLEPKLSEIIQSLPSVTGVYYIHNDDGDIIYIGKSKNIKNRINQHFAGQAPKSKKIQLEVASVTYEPTGSELLALLKESAEIKHHKPKYNRALRRTIFTHGLFSFSDENGYLNLKVEKIKGKAKPITTFSNIQSGKSFMNKVVEKYHLCQKLCGLYKTKSGCFIYTIKECEGACAGEELVESYNSKVQKLIEKHSFKTKSMIIVDYGRSVDERSAVWIEDGILRGFTYFNLNFQINNIEILKKLITTLEHNKDAQNIKKSYRQQTKR